MSNSNNQTIEKEKTMEANDMKALCEAICTLRAALREIRNDVLDMVTNHKSEDPDSYAHGLCLSIGGACDMALNSTKRFDNADKALSAPPRNCDVGTAEEQVKRFKEYCASNMQYYRDMCGTHEGAGGWDCREDCPIGMMIDKNDLFCDHCELIWAQMPYEEGDVK